MTSNQQQFLACQPYYQHYYQQWNGYIPYGYPYPGYMPAYTVPPPQPTVPPPPVSTFFRPVQSYARRLIQFKGYRRQIFVVGIVFKL